MLTRGDSPEEPLISPSNVKRIKLYSETFLEVYFIGRRIGTRFSYLNKLKIKNKKGNSNCVLCCVENK